MINIYIKDFNQNGRIVTGETLMQKIPADSEGGLRLITPIVKAEMGTVDGLDFSIESGTPFYDAFKQMKTFIRVVYDGTTIFYGRVLTIDNNSFRGTRKIRCEGPMAFLMDSPVEGVEESKRTNISTYEYIQQLLDNHNSYINNEANKRFLVGEVPGHYSGWVSAAQRVKNDTRPFGSDSWTDTKSALEDLRSHYGGYFRMRPAGGIGGGIYLDWMNHYFNPNTINQKIEVGKNILDISNVTEIDNVFTAIVPIGKHNVTTSEDGKSSSKQEDLYVDGKVVRVPDICNKYSYDELSQGYHRYEDYRDAISKYGMIIKQVSFPNAENKTTLYNEACEWIKNNYQGEVTKFTVKAIDMHQIGENVAKINVGDRVTIVYPVAKEDGTFPKQSTTQTCLSIQYDLYHPENNSYTFGIPANILTKTYGLKKQGKSVNSASTSPSSGGGGGGGGGKKDWFWGYVVPWLQRHGLKYNPPGQKRDPNNPYWPYPGDAKGLEYTSGNMMLIISGNSKTPAYLKKTLVKGSKVGSSWAGVLTSYDIDAYNHKLSEQVFYDYKVLEYVQWEYGIDLRTYFAGVTAPTSITTEEGLTKFFGAVKDVVTGVWMMFEEFVINPIKDSGLLNIFDLNYWFPGDNLPTSVAGFDIFGNYNYRYFTPDGELVNVNQRELHVKQLHDEANIGWIIDEDPQTGERSFKNAGAMYLALEGHAGAQIVTAHLAGEVMYLGNYKTQKYYATSVNHMDQVCGDFEYVEDQTEPDGRKLVVHSGAGMRQWHAKIKKVHPDGTKEYEYDDQGRLKWAEFGLYDNDTLKGGLIVEHLNDGSNWTKIKGDIVDIKAEQMARIGIWTNDKFDAGVIIDRINEGKNADGKQVLGTRISLSADQVIAGNSYPNLKAWLEDQGESIDETAGLLAEKITAYEARFHTIETDYLKTSKLYSEIAALQSVSVAKLTSERGGIAVHSVDTTTYTQGGVDCYVPHAITALQIVQSGNNYTLQYKWFSSEDWRDAENGTFSRAITSWTGSGWSGGTYTAKATPQNQSISTTLRLLSPTGDISKSGKSVSRRYNVQYGPDDEHTYNTGFSQSVSIDASSVYSDGYSSGQSAGWTAGFNSGYEEGYSQGYSDAPKGPTSHRGFVYDGYEFRSSEFIHKYHTTTTGSGCPTGQSSGQNKQLYWY